MKFRNHPSVSAIRNAFNLQSLSFSKVSIDDVLKEINTQGNRQAIQSTDIPVKILKQNANIFASYICHIFNPNLGELLGVCFPRLKLVRIMVEP